MKAEKTLAFILLIFDFVVMGSIDRTPEFFSQRGLKIEVKEPLIFFGNNAFRH